MCLIIVNPSGAALPDEHLSNGWQRNHDSAGYMFAHNGTLVIRKPFYKLSALRHAISADRQSCPEATFVIHFRYSTHGGNTEENCHPHSICGGQVGLVHNGILNDFLPPWDADYSDTVHFCRTVLNYRRAVDVMDETFRAILAAMIGTGNKFVLLRETGDLSIVNEAQGEWFNGNWYSNKGYQAPKLEPVSPAKYGSLFGVPLGAACSSALVTPSGKRWDDLSESEWRAAKADEADEELEELDDATTELEHMDYVIDRLGWSSLHAWEQDEYIALYEKVNGKLH